MFFLPFRVLFGEDGVLMRLRTISLMLSWLWLCACCWPWACMADDFFSERVAPILESRCLGCHNDQQLAGDLSLQSMSGLSEGGFVQPGISASSHLVDLITPEDGQAAMPKDAAPLSTEQIDVIRQWVDAGANWTANLRLQSHGQPNFDWWSLKSLRRPQVPKIKDAWVSSPIDAFVLRKMREYGLGPTVEADRRTLLRRLTYDLTGLPPTEREIRDFVGDSSPTAYERVVDRLLNSPHYGERWARHWLDIVKYADTCGYDKDKLRPNAWPYRDYVIRSLNSDKAYQRFVQEQLAGDVLFPSDPDGIVGLGFIAAGPWDFIGHVEVPESKIDGKVARNLDRDDMVSNTFNTFCSLTIQCARCHHHKFDPFTQQQYYGLQAIFAAVDRADRPYDLDSAVEKKRRLLIAELASLKSEREKVRQEIAHEGGERLDILKQRVAELQQRQGLIKNKAFGFHSSVAENGDSTKWVEVAVGQPTHISKVVLHPCHDDFGGIGAGFGFPVRFRVDAIVVDPSTGKQSQQLIADCSQQDFPNPGLNAVELNCAIDDVNRVRVTATKLAPRKSDFIFALAEVELHGRNQIDLAEGSVLALDSIDAPPRWHPDNLTDGEWPKYQDLDARRKLVEAEQELQNFLTQLESEERLSRLRAAEQGIEQFEQEIQQLPAARMVYAAATHFAPQGQFKPTQGQPRPVYMLQRGEVQQPREEVDPGLLPLHEEDDWRLKGELSESERRAELALWLTRKGHPLTWRSIVNRIWQYHFGQGLVATPNDFGRMGAEPSHPELLDWLACEFLDNGQSFKALHRLIVTSSVYRQASVHDADMAAIDGSNRYLWRMNRRRLDAEEIRDSILLASGALDRSMGGPGYYLFELERPEHSPHFEYHKFDPAESSSHRRSIYRFVVRSQPDPWMTTLDCADSSQSTPRRTETLTALQALTLLNSRFNLVMAERCAENLQRQSDDLHTQCELAWRIVTQRAPEAAEQSAIMQFARTHGLPNLCRYLFNLNELAYVD